MRLLASSVPTRTTGKSGKQWALGDVMGGGEMNEVRRSIEG
jgi:hypothetical protein